MSHSDRLRQCAAGAGRSNKWEKKGRFSAFLGGDLHLDCTWMSTYQPFVLPRGLWSQRPRDLWPGTREAKLQVHNKKINQSAASKGAAAATARLHVSCLEAALQDEWWRKNKASNIHIEGKRRRAVQLGSEFEQSGFHRVFQYFVIVWLSLGASTALLILRSAFLCLEINVRGCNVI